MKIYKMSKNQKKNIAKSHRMIKILLEQKKKKKKQFFYKKNKNL